MPTKRRCLPRGKANKVMAKVRSPDGDQHAKTIGSQAVAHKAINVQSIIREDSQADVQFVVLPSMSLRSVPVQSSQKPRMSSGMSRIGSMKTLNGMMINGSRKSMKRPRARKEKGKDLSRKASQRARMPQDQLLHDRHSLHLQRVSDPNPNPNPKHSPA